ncbi:MAG: ATP-binding protein [Acetobacteraceae bacterium]
MRDAPITTQEVWDAFLDVAPAAFAVLGQDMTCVAASRRWKRVYQLENRNITGLGHFDLFPDLSEPVKAAHRRCLDGAAEQCDGAPFRQPGCESDRILWDLRPWYRGGRQVGGIVVSATARPGASDTDGISDARQAPIHDFHEAMPSAVLTLDAAGTILTANTRAEIMFGYGSGELVGEALQTILPGPLSVRERAPPAGEPHPVAHGHEQLGVRRNGSEFPVEVYLNLVPVGNDAAAIASILDITERKRTDDALRQAQKVEAIGNLTGGLAHDFNNLLGIMIANLELARERSEADTELHDLITQAVDAGWRGAELIQRFLAFARRQPLQPRQVDVNQMVSDTVTMLRRLLRDDIQIALSLSPAAWPVRVDMAQLEASLANLAMNARDAMPRGGHLIFTTDNRHFVPTNLPAGEDDLAGDFVAIEVSDTGIGMSEEVQSRIFEPFFTTKPLGEGTGLGLSMVFGFIRQSGGHIRVYSEPGRGTTVSLFLPRDRTVEVSPEETAQRGIVRGNGQIVLVVEDNADMRRILRRQLVELGYRVLECDNAGVALSTLGREPIDVLLTDVVVPGELDGIELARFARARWPHVRVVFMSGFPLGQLAAADDDLAGLPFLRKPYSKTELSAVLETALRLPPARRPAS